MLFLGGGGGLSTQEGLYLDKDGTPEVLHGTVRIVSATSNFLLYSQTRIIKVLEADRGVWGAGPRRITLIDQKCAGANNNVLWSGSAAPQKKHLCDDPMAPRLEPF